MIKGGWAEQIALFCTPENYGHIEKIVRSKYKDMEES